MSGLLFDEEYTRIFGYRFDGQDKWFVFQNNDCFSVYKENNKYIKRLATAFDWIGIGGNDSIGFVECDFRGCDFKKFDITGTRFTRCIFDYDAFDYSFVKYDGMIDCEFVSDTVKK
jgi:hypothetical protein